MYKDNKKSLLKHTKSQEYMFKPKFSRRDSEKVETLEKEVKSLKTKVKSLRQENLKLSKLIEEKDLELNEVKSFMLSEKAASFLLEKTTVLIKNLEKSSTALSSFSETGYSPDNLKDLVVSYNLHEALLVVTDFANNLISNHGELAILDKYSYLASKSEALLLDIGQQSTRISKLIGKKDLPVYSFSEDKLK